MSKQAAIMECILSWHYRCIKTNKRWHLKKNKKTKLFKMLLWTLWYKRRKNTLWLAVIAYVIKEWILGRALIVLPAESQKLLIMFTLLISANIIGLLGVKTYSMPYTNSILCITDVYDIFPHCRENIFIIAWNGVVLWTEGT